MLKDFIKKYKAYKNLKSLYEIIYFTRVDFQNCNLKTYLSRNDSEATKLFQNFFLNLKKILC